VLAATGTLGEIEERLVALARREQIHLTAASIAYFTFISLVRCYCSSSSLSL
jgi:hypothetical protein